MRGSERSHPARRGAPRAAARLALLALVLQLVAPSLHTRGLGFDRFDGPRAGNLARDAGSFAQHDDQGCPVCAASAQRSHGLAPDVAARPLAGVAGERLAVFEPARAHRAPQRSPGSPRAPPASSSTANA